MVDVILVEESPSESALACIAIALRRPATRVGEARSLREAKLMLERQGERGALVILGWHALRNGLESFFQGTNHGTTVIGLAADVGDSARERALRAGVRAIYDKPVEWSAYVGAVDAILGEWLASPVASGE